MKKWWQRVFGIYLLAVGLACLFFPFRDYRSKDVDVETVVASPIGFVDQAEESGGELQICGLWFALHPCDSVLESIG